MTKPRILVTPRSVSRNGHPALQRLRDAGFDVVFCTPGRQPDEAELVRLLPGCVGYLAGVEKISAAVLAQATALRTISRNGTGVDNVAMAAALAALESGQLGGLASDVLAGEPPANRHLAGHPRAIVTPHCGGLTRESVDRAVTQAVDNRLEGLA